MSLGVALSKDETYKKFARYTNSTVYAMLSKSRAKRDLQDRVAAKIGEKTHTSLKVAKQQFPYLEIMFQNNEIAWELAEYFRLENDEVKLFRSRKIKKPKTVQSKTIQEENQVKKVSNSKKIVDKKIKEKITSIHPPVKKIKSTQNKESIKKEDKIEDSKSKSNKKVSKSKSKEKQVSLFSFK
jgi:replication factor C large subunit